MNIKGKIETILPVETGMSKAQKEWSKQTVIINNGSEYNPLTAISWFGDDKIKMLKSYKVGQSVEVSVNLSSREFNGSWYHNVDGWKISVVDGNTEKKAETAGEEVDDLPF